MEHGDDRWSPPNSPGELAPVQRPPLRRDDAVRRAQSTVATLRDELETVLGQVARVEDLLAGASAGPRLPVSRAIVVAEKVAAQTAIEARVEAASMADDADARIRELGPGNEPAELLKDVQQDFGALYRDHVQEMWSSMTTTRDRLVAVVKDMAIRMDEDLAALDLVVDERRAAGGRPSPKAEGPPDRDGRAPVPGPAGPGYRQVFRAEGTALAESGVRTVGPKGFDRDERPSSGRSHEGKGERSSSKWFDPDQFIPPKPRRSPR